MTAEDVKDWAIAPAFEGLTKQQIPETADEPGFWRSIKPVPGAAEALKHFMDEGHEVYIVTASEMKDLKDKMQDSTGTTTRKQTT